jgi:hypothetical protein
MNESSQIRHLADRMVFEDRAQQRAAIARESAAFRPEPTLYPVQDIYDRNAGINMDLISKFVDWADDNGIEYNSPSYFAHGWRLGVRGIALSTFRRGTSDGQIQDELSGPVPVIIGHEYSLRSLIVKNDGGVGEIRVVGTTEDVVDDPEPDFLARFQIARPIDNTLGRYRPMSIVQSIARLSAKHRVKWTA